MAKSVKRELSLIVRTPDRAKLAPVPPAEQMDGKAMVAI